MTPLDMACTQADFGDLVGISQQAVSDLIKRDVIKPGATAGQWLIDYCQHLRETAAGRDPDGELATERARVARETADKIAMANAVTRREYAPVGLLEVVLGDVARQIATRLDAVVPQLRRRLPDMPSAALAAISAELAACRALCASASLADAERLEREALGEDEEAA